MSVTKRCNAYERKHFGDLARAQKKPGTQVGEPALGTLSERLDIIIRRLGGTTGAVRMTVQERLEYERWLIREGVRNVA